MGNQHGMPQWMRARKREKDRSEGEGVLCNKASRGETMALCIMARAPLPALAMKKEDAFFGNTKVTKNNVIVSPIMKFNIYYSVR